MKLICIYLYAHYYFPLNLSTLFSPILPSNVCVILKYKNWTENKLRNE